MRIVAVVVRMWAVEGPFRAVLGRFRAVEGPLWAVVKWYRAVLRPGRTIEERLQLITPVFSIP